MGCADDVDCWLVKCVLRLLLCPILLTANVQRIVAHSLCASVPQCVQLPALVSTLCLRGSSSSLYAQLSLPTLDLPHTVGVNLACELPQSRREDFLERFEQRPPVVSQSPCLTAATHRLIGCCPARTVDSAPHSSCGRIGTVFVFVTSLLPTPLLVCPTSLERNVYASAAADHRFFMRPTSSAASVNSSSSSNHWVSRSCFLSTTWLLQSKCLRHGPMLILHSAIAPATYIVSVRIVLWMLPFEAIRAVHWTDKKVPQASALPISSINQSTPRSC